jgi:hypothetical protein
MLSNTFAAKRRWLTVCVTCVWAGVDSACEQEKLEARKMLENAAESHQSGARFVGQWFWKKHWLDNEFTLSIVYYRATSSS